MTGKKIVNADGVLTRGELRGADGALVPGQDAVQMRLAMNSLLNRAGVVHEGLIGDEDGRLCF